MHKEVLVVDDEPQVCRALTAYFEEKGFRVITADTAEAALARIPQMHADVVLLDLRLPDSSGLEVLSTIKQRYPQVRVVIISGLADEATIEAARSLGASEYLTKPFDFGRCFFAAMGIESIDVAAATPDPEALARVPADVALAYQILPMKWDGQQLHVVMSEPLDTAAVARLQELLGYPTIPMAALAGDLATTVQQWYGASPTSQAAPAVTPAHLRQEAQHLADRLLHDACAHRANLLHLQCGPRGPQLQYRIDGRLVVGQIPEPLATRYADVLSQFKRLAGIPTDMARCPQHGHGRVALGTGEVELRVSVLPSTAGEALTVRLGNNLPVLTLDQLGLGDEQRRQLESLLAKPAGLLLVTGPARVGKTMTVYTLLNRLAASRGPIVTLESPVERAVPGLIQLELQPHEGLAAADGIRAALDHEADVIMVNELIDSRAAIAAVRAAATGHVVLSTLHTTTAAMAITRLLDLEIEPFLICSSLLGVVSQRLVRKLCPSCRQPYTLDTPQVAQLAALGLPVTAGVPGVAKLWRAHGCSECRQTGYQGQVGIFELLSIDPHLRGLIIKRTPSVQLQQSAMSRGMDNLWRAGWEHVRAGVTSLQELMLAMAPDTVEHAAS